MDEIPTPVPRLWPHGPIVLAPPRHEWASEFATEAATLVCALGDLPVELHHIGSTAVPGLLAKPVIDIAAAVPALDALDMRTVHVVALGYTALGEYGMPGRRYFRKNDSDGARTHHIHAFVRGSSEIARHLAFRDYLRAFPDAAARYAALKQALAARHGADHGAYSEGKAAFVREIERRAALWQARG